MQQYSRDGTLVGYTFSKRYKKVSPHRKSHNLLYNLLKEKNKPPQEMVNKRGVPFGPTWLTRTLAFDPTVYFYLPIKAVEFIHFNDSFDLTNHILFFSKVQW